MYVVGSVARHKIVLSEVLSAYNRPKESCNFVEVGLVGGGGGWVISEGRSVSF